MALGFVKVFLAQFADFLKRVSGSAASLTGRVKEKTKIGSKLRKTIAAAVVGAVVVITSLMLILARNARPALPSQDSDAVAELFRMELPPEELFLGGEPDFLPRLIPERERRDAWDADNARPYWTNPGGEGAVYEGMMSAVVDEIMEQVP
jgi:hypothetical protein